MSVEMWASLIEGHARLQRRAQPLLNEIRKTDEKITIAKLDMAKHTEKQRIINGSSRAYDKAQRIIASLVAENESKNAELRELVAPQAKKSCLALCERLSQDLPREIRDLIYCYLHAHDTIYLGPEYFQSTKQPAETDRDAHYWDAHFVGDEVQRELVESWYRTTQFYFYDKRHNAEVVPQFLDTDRWQLDIKPRHFICKARLELDASNELLIEQSHSHNPPPSHDHGPPRSIRGTRPLENLHLLPNHVSFFIRIHTYCAVFKDPLFTDHLRATVDDLHRILDALHSAGHKFVVLWPDYDNLEFTWRDCASSVDAWMKRLQSVQRPALYWV